MATLFKLKERKIFRQTIKQCYHLPVNHERAVKTGISIVYLQFHAIQNIYLIQTLVFLAGVDLKK